MRISSAARVLVALAFLASAGSAGAQPKPAPAKTLAKPPPKTAKKDVAKPKKGAPAKKARKPGEAGEPDEAIRRAIAGTGSSAGRSTKESAELRAMRELDQQLFPPQGPSAGQPWLAEGSPLVERGEPRTFASGMPPQASLAQSAPPPRTEDMSWLRKLEMPDIPVRWDARVVRYLDHYKNTPRGRAMVRDWIRRSGRYGASIRRTLREQGLPEDVLWLALVESGFDPTVHSPAGAAGLWQFMPEGAQIYGLTVDRWIDERLDPERSTVAAARYLTDLKQRFGNWELAFAAYNMGYGGLLASIRKYNTNDFWELSRLESGMPLETALYVPKIVAMAIVSRNRAVFGCQDVELDPSMAFDKIAVGSGVSLKSVAAAAEVPVESVTELNPQMIATRAPPTAPGSREEPRWTVRVPPGKGVRAADALAKAAGLEPKLERYRVRWGESLDDIATQRGTTRSSLAALNGLRRDEVIRPGTLLFVPASPGIGQAAAVNLLAEGRPVRPTIVVPAQVFSYPDRQRLFYRVTPGDTIRDVSKALSVSPDELSRWNVLDAGALLHDGMTLQVFLPRNKKLDRVALLPESEARVLAVGTPEFFTHFEALRGRKRVELVAREGDTWKALAKRYGLTLGQMERINHRSRSSALTPGEKLVVYVPQDRSIEPTAIDKPDEAVAVAKPVDADDVAPKDEGVTPANLRQPVPRDDAAPAAP
jgi:membrane-bound lytic murein transglycosylase D